MTIDDVRALFDILEAAGLRPPYTDPEGLERTAGVWLEVFRDREFDELTLALHAHLRTPRGAWWPKPAELLAHLPAPPRRRRAPTTLAPGDWTGKTWASIADGRIRVAILDRCIRELLGREPRPCGHAACSPLCEPCNEAWMRRADELALEHVPGPLEELPTEYDDARARAGLSDDDEVVDQGASW